MRKSPPVEAQVEALKTRKDKKFYELSLRDDLSQLIAVGLARNPGMTQRELTKLAGWKWESYVSRLIHCGANFTASAAARVLVPLGIRPMLVDTAEWKRLKAIEDRQSHPTTKSTYGVEDHDGEERIQYSGIRQQRVFLHVSERRDQFRAGASSPETTIWNPARPPYHMVRSLPGQFAVDS